ncbi:hypothetical protein B296_00006786 [Ensete ventricosum]|uniref:Uncharacterized protein n=1 Tax=Ensete ventricosum TaxID=4639 RepID=A0A426ZYG5_ENSVE|nr:hypothetical protein B296_00006786 [Ensete ventricosum]
MHRADLKISQILRGIIILFSEGCLALPFYPHPTTAIVAIATKRSCPRVAALVCWGRHLGRPPGPQAHPRALCPQAAATTCWCRAVSHCSYERRAVSDAHSQKDALALPFYPHPMIVIVATHAMLLRAIGGCLCPWSGCFSCGRRAVDGRPSGWLPLQGALAITDCPLVGDQAMADYPLKGSWSWSATLIEGLAVADHPLSSLPSLQNHSKYV